MGSDVATWSAGALADAIAAGQLSSRELLDLYLDRIERLNPPINAVVTLDVERAREAAAAADEATARGDRLRQDQLAALVGRHAELQRDVRYDQQPVGARSGAGRVVRRCRRRRRV